MAAGDDLDRHCLPDYGAAKASTRLRSPAATGRRSSRGESGRTGEEPIMKHIVEPAREVEIVEEADVVVAGGGPAGIAAAVAAARRGARTVLIERYGFLGGLATAGLVAPILGHTAARSRTPIVEGILRELAERMHRLDGAPPWEETLARGGIAFDAEALKRAADQMTREAGVRLLFHALVVGAPRSESSIDALLVESKSGRQAVRAATFVDTTGDADLAFHAGAPVLQGRPFDGRVQSMGSVIHIGGLEDLTREQREEARRLVEKAMEEGQMHFYNAGFTALNSYHRDHFSPNMTRAAGDPTDVRDLTAAELSIREEAWKLIEFLRSRVPGCEKAYLQQSAPQVGPRESRRIEGEAVLTGEDIREGRRYPDAVARGSWWIDIHCPLGFTHPVHLCVRECPRADSCPYWAAEHDSAMLSVDELRPPEGGWYDVRYGSLVARGVDNLLVAGRAISATHEGLAGARIMATGAATGEAAGIAAAMAAHHGLPVREVEVSTLRERLTAAGALV